MIRFECDYTTGAHPKILEALVNSNMEACPGYGVDIHCERARIMLRALCQAPEAGVHFLTGGTQANTTVIAAALRPHQGALCAETGHINTHETGAVEATGHKVLALPAENGKITARQIDRYCQDHYDNEAWEHMVQPGMVYLSLPTELGTVYTLAELEAQHGPLPETWMCLTGGGGVHYYFACDDPALTVGTGFAPGLDYRGAGGYVVAPPSLHANGREYEWEAAHTPANTALAPLPDWLHSLMLEGRKQAPRTRTEAAPEKVQEGGRNDTLYRLACFLRGKGLGEAGITAALLAENRERCVPPLPAAEVEKIAKSAGRYERGSSEGRGHALSWDGSPEGSAQEPPKEAQPLRVISAPDLQRAQLPPVKYLVDGLLPEGTSLLTAASKVGKSWMVLDLGLCIAAGEPFLGRPTTKTGTLYLALEDSLNRLQNRMDKVLGGKPPPPLFCFTTEAPKLDDGLLDVLEDHLKKCPDTRLLIVDTLQKVRGQALPREGPYAQDYQKWRRNRQ